MSDHRLIFVIGRPSQLGAGEIVRCTILLQEAVSALNKQGYSLVGPEDYTAPNGQVFTTWLDRARGLKVDLQEHPRFDVLFLELSAGSSRDLDQVRDSLSAYLPKVASDSLLKAALDEMERDPASLYRLAMGAPLHYDEDIGAVFRNALVHPLPSVREFAAYGATLTNWTELADALQEQLSSEAHPQVRAMLEQGIRAMASFARHKG